MLKIVMHSLLAGRLAGWLAGWLLDLMDGLLDVWLLYVLWQVCQDTVWYTQILVAMQMLILQISSKCKTGYT